MYGLLESAWGGSATSEKLRPSCAAMDWTAIVMRESDPALEGDKLPQIDDGELPGKAIELPAQRNRVFPGCKHAGEFPESLRRRWENQPDKEVMRCAAQSAMRRPGCTPQLFLYKQTAIHRMIEAPCRQFPDFQMLSAHGNISQSHIRAP